MSQFYTSFFRNRPLLELAYRLSDKKCEGSNLAISVLGCSIGAEVYSILWTIRSRRPDLKVNVRAIDISKDVLEFAQRGVYPLGFSQFTDAAVLGSVTKQETLELFDNDGVPMCIKPWLREGISWRVGDAADPRLTDVLGPQDMVFANNLLCHMYPIEAERCLRNIVGLVAPGGYLFVSGIDLDVRTRVVRDLRLEPVVELIEDIHNGDLRLVTDWPFKYWGLEPFSMRRQDWRIRYSSVFYVTNYYAEGSVSPEKPPSS
jgi:SAM-dependent methyltransferase